MSVEWNIGNIVTKRSTLTPDKSALIFEGRHITYKELNVGINRVAHYFQEKGLKKGDRISVLLRNCPEFLNVYFASAKLGLIIVPLNFRMVGPEIEYQINNSESRLLIFHDIFVDVINAIRSCEKVRCDEFIFVESEFKNAFSCPEWAKNYHEVMSNYPTDEPIPEDPVMLDDPMCIMYTSGVTGHPKGAVLSHQQTYFKNFQVILYTDMRSDDSFLTQAPVFHSAGLFAAITPTFCRGGTIIMRQAFQPEQFALDIERYKATIIFAMTSMWRMILQTKKLDDIDTSSVRVVLGGGERTPATIIDELAKRGIYMREGYGQTENSFMMSLPKKDIQRKKGSVGLPGFFTEVWIADKNGNKLAPGEVGEIVAKGPNVMMGYWNMPEKTAETIVKGVLHTGDLGYMDEEGYFYLVDRAKDMYRSGGENVYPAEVEKVLIDHPKIANVAIIGVPDEKWGETGKAFVVPKKRETLTKDEILSFLYGKVSKFKFPAYVEFIDELPMTASGKIRKAALKEKKSKFH